MKQYLFMGNHDQLIYSLPDEATRDALLAQAEKDYPDTRFRIGETQEHSGCVHWQRQPSYVVADLMCETMYVLDSPVSRDKIKRSLEHGDPHTRFYTGITDAYTGAIHWDENRA